MYSTPVTIKTANNDADMVGLINSLERVAQPTTGDLLYAGQRQRSRILERTSRGVDFEEKAFHPYSTVGPYYFYPGKNAKNRGAARARLANKLGIKKVGETKIGKGGVKSNFANKGNKGSALSATRTRLGIKFSSYAAFKAFLGRSVVDLFGPWAPHMLQAMIVKVGGVTLTGDTAQGNLFDTSNDGGNSSTAPASEIIIGIYGEEADRASGHNEGARYLPQRKFLGASESDKDAVLGDIISRVANRVRRVLGGKS